MSIWRAPLKSSISAPHLWVALWRDRLSIALSGDAKTGEWCCVISRIDRQQVRRIVVETTAGSDQDAMVAAVSQLPGLMVRLALLETLL